MSYILDAIRHADQNRTAGSVPDVLSSHTSEPRARRGRWRPAIAAGLALIGASLVIVAASSAPRRHHGLPAEAPVAGGPAPGEPAPGAHVSAGSSALALPAAPPIEIDLAPPPPGARTSAPVPPLPFPLAAETLAGESLFPQAEPPEAFFPQAVLAESVLPEAVPAEPGAKAEARRSLPKPGTSPSFERVARQLRAEAKALVAQEEPARRGAARPSPPPAAPAERARAVVAEPSADTDRSGGEEGGGRVAIPHARELPPDIQAQLPAIAVSLHLYAREPSARRVGVGGKVLHEGEAVAGDLAIARITRDGVVFRFRDREFFLGALDEWRARRTR